MLAAPALDLSAIPAAQRAAVQALFAGLDWRKVKALEMRPPAAVE